MSDDTRLLHNNISWVKLSLDHMQNLRTEELINITSDFQKTDTLKTWKQMGEQ